MTPEVWSRIGQNLLPAYRHRMLDRLERGDILIVTKMDRLGRNTIDVSSTVERLEEIGIRVHCLALGGVDLASPAGKMTMNVINAVAQFERDLLIERTNAGLRRAKSEGKKLGRPSALTSSQRGEIQSALQSGQKVAPLAKRYNVSRQTIMRIREGLRMQPGNVDVSNPLPPAAFRYTVG